MTLSVEDRLAIMETISLHGQFADSGELDRWDEVFTPDVTYDISDLGFGVIEGLAALRDVALRLGDGNAVGHHVTNIVLEALPDESVLARSKGIGIKLRQRDLRGHRRADERRLADRPPRHPRPPPTPGRVRRPVGRVRTTQSCHAVYAATPNARTAA